MIIVMLTMMVGLIVDWVHIGKGDQRMPHDWEQPDQRWCKEGFWFQPDRHPFRICRLFWADTRSLSFEHKDLSEHWSGGRAWPSCTLRWVDGVGWHGCVKVVQRTFQRPSTWLCALWVRQHRSDLQTKNTGVPSTQSAWPTHHVPTMQVGPTSSSSLLQSSSSYCTWPKFETPNAPILDCGMYRIIDAALAPIRNSWSQNGAFLTYILCGKLWIY